MLIQHGVTWKVATRCRESISVVVVGTLRHHATQHIHIRVKQTTAIIVDEDEAMSSGFICALIAGLSEAREKILQEVIRADTH